MTKAEIIEAINATIRPNGEKAITAESLANLLIEMANATPEGGGGSGVCVVQVGKLEDGSDLTAEQLAKNADVYNKVTEADFNIPVFIMGVSAMFQAIEEDGSYTFSFSIAYTSDPETYVLMGFVAGFALYPDGSINLIM